MGPPGDPIMGCPGTIMGCSKEAALPGGIAGAGDATAGEAGAGGPGVMTGCWASAALALTKTTVTEASNPLLIGLPFNFLMPGPTGLKAASAGCYGASA
jgi:hypothetical protein